MIYVATDSKYKGGHNMAKTLQLGERVATDSKYKGGHNSFVVLSNNPTVATDSKYKGGHNLNRADRNVT